MAILHIRIIGYVLLFLTFFLGTAYASVPPHTEDHDEHTAKEVSSTEIARMEQLVSVLKQLVILLSALKVEQSSLHAPVTPHVVENAHEMMDMHHDEHSSETATIVATSTHEMHAEKKLIIEIESHANGTHAHVRYVDKPEAMFFVDASIDNENGIVAGIVAKTGLSVDEVQTALKYMH